MTKYSPLDVKESILNIIDQGESHVFESGCAPTFSGTFSSKNWVCPHRSLPLSDPKSGCARAHPALKVTHPLPTVVLKTNEMIDDFFQKFKCRFTDSV